MEKQQAGEEFITAYVITYAITMFVMGMSLITKFLQVGYDYTFFQSVFLSLFVWGLITYMPTVFLWTWYYTKFFTYKGPVLRGWDAKFYYLVARQGPTAILIGLFFPSAFGFLDLMVNPSAFKNEWDIFMKVIPHALGVTWFVMILGNEFCDSYVEFLDEFCGRKKKDV